MLNKSGCILFYLTCTGNNLKVKFCTTDAQITLKQTVKSFHNIVFRLISNLKRHHSTRPVLTGELPADVLHSTCVVMMPVCDDDLLDAGVKLLQCLFEIADVFRHSGLSGVYQHSPAIYQ